MDNFGLHDKIEIANREFHIHTGTLIEQNKILTEVFEKGMFLMLRELPINLRKKRQNHNYDFLSRVTEDFHHKVIEEIEALYQVEAKLAHYRHPKSHYYLGILFLKRDLFEEAIKQFKMALEQDNNYTKAMLALGIGYLKSRKFITAKETFKAAQNMSEKFPDFLNYYGLTQLFLNEFDEAMTLFKDAIKLNPNYVEAQFNLGVALYKTALKGAKDPNAVAVPARVSIYLKQVRDLPKYRVPHWNRAFNQLIGLVKDNVHSVIIPELEQFQLKLVDLMYDREKIYEFYLRFLFGGKELDVEVIDNYEEDFVAEDTGLKHYPDYWNDLGTFKLIKSRGLFLKAMDEFEKSLQLAPNFEDARHNLKMIKSHEKGFMILLRAILK